MSAELENFFTKVSPKWIIRTFLIKGGLDQMIFFD